MCKRWIGLAALLFSLRGAEAANVGSGFGESVLVLTSARQAGSGGIALEDPWRRGSIIEANSVLLTSGLQWFGGGYQGGLGSTLRLGGEVFVFSPPASVRTFENSDGTFGGNQGTVSAPEWGGRLLGQFSILNTGGWKVAALGRVSGLIQQLPDSSNSGFAIEAGGQGQLGLGGGRFLTTWALAGPLGRGAGLGYAGQVTGGAGLMAVVPKGLLGGAEGYAIGAEGQWLTEGLMHGGVGGLYWFGKLNAPGATFFLRAGLRYAAQSAQVYQPRGGLGVLWRTKAKWGFQFDYAVVPIGELGMYHYATVGMRLPPLRVRERVQESYDPSARGAPKRTEEIIYFCPPCGEKARINVEVQSESTFTATLMDGEARFVLLKLVEPKTVQPGDYRVEWDGLLNYGIPATLGVPHTVRITANNETRYVKVTAVDSP